MLAYMPAIAGVLLIVAIVFYLYSKSKMKKKLGIEEDEEGSREAGFMDYLIAILVLAVALVFAYLFYFKEAGTISY